MTQTLLLLTMALQLSAPLAYGQVVSPSLGADFTTTPTVPTLTSLQANQVAGNYQRCQQQANALQFSSGASTVLSTLTAGASRSGSGSVGIGGDCSATGKSGASEDVPDEVPECYAFESSGGVYDPTAIRTLKAQVDASIAIISCKENKLTAIKQEISCLTQQANLINSQIQQIQTPLLAKFQKMTTDMSTITDELNNRQSQLDDTNLKLNGSPSPNAAGSSSSGGGSGQPGTGAQGLLVQQNTTQQLVAKMQGDILALQQAQTQVTNDQQSFNQEVAYRTMALASTCFQKTPVPGFQCSLPGAASNPTESPMNYLLCRYQQNETELTSNGVVQNNNALLQAQGNQAYAQLSALLSQIMSQTPQTAAVPLGGTTPDQANQATVTLTQENDQGATILTAADVETEFGSQLAALNGKGINVHDFVMKYLGSCFQKATAQVAVERQSAKSSLGQVQAKLQSEVAVNMAQADQLMKQYNQVWSDDMKALTGQSVPLNLTNCIDQQPQIQLSCVNDIQNNFNGLLNGTTNNSVIQMAIQGTNAAQNITFTCSGLNGCVASLQNLATNLARERTTISTFAKNYVTQANQGIDTYVSQMRQALSPQAGALQTQLQSINTQLATLGVSQGLDIKPIDGTGATLTKNPLPPPLTGDGLYQQPTNLLALIGSGTTPPLLDVSGNNFSSALGGIAQAITDETSKLGKATNYVQRLTARANQCKQTDIEAKAKAYDTDVQSIQSLKCSSSYQWCNTNNPTDLSTLAGSVSTALSQYNVGTETSNITGILQGAGGACQTTTSTIQNSIGAIIGDCKAVGVTLTALGPSDNINTWMNNARALCHDTKDPTTGATISLSTDFSTQMTALTNANTSASATCDSIYSRLNNGKNQLVQDLNRMNAGSAN